jgi:hypothetical protein
LKMRFTLVLAVLMVAACATAVVESPLSTGASSVPPATLAPTSAPSAAPSSTGSTAVPSAAPTASGNVAPGGAEIELVLTGGMHAGTYRGVAEQGDACTLDAPGMNGAFQVTYSQPSAPDGFTSFMLSVRDPEAAEEDDTDNFSLTIHIDKPIGSEQYRIDPVIGEGGGAVLLESTPGGEATLDVAGQTTDGIDIEGSVICNAVTGG